MSESGAGAEQKDSSSSGGGGGGGGSVTKAGVIGTGVLATDLGGDVAGAAAAVKINSGDVSVTTGVSTVNTVLTGKTPVEISRFLGFSQVVRPSGDSTGATDLAAINAALAAGTNTSVYLNGNYTVNSTVLIPSGMTLILADAQITAAASVLKPVVSNFQAVVGSGNTGDSNIHIRGIGRAVIDGFGTSNAEQTSHLYQSTGILLCNVSKFSVKDITIQNCSYVHLMMQACTDGEVRNYHGVKGTSDLGGIHVACGSSNITVDGMTCSGSFVDSFITLAAAAATGYVTPWVATFGTTVGAYTVSGVAFRNATIASAVNMVNLINDSYGSITNCSFTNFHNNYTGATTGNEFSLGPAGYSGETIPVNGTLSGISIANYTTSAKTTFLIMDSPLTDLTVDNVRYTSGSACQALVANNVALTAGAYPQHARWTFNNIRIPTLTGALMKAQAGWQITDFEFNNVLIGTANGGLLQNASDVTGLKLTRIHVGTLNANPFQSTSTETGSVQDFTFDNKAASLTSIMPTATALQIQLPFPGLSSADTTPLPTRGSQILAYNTKDPTGGSATTGGLYVADGKAWNLTLSLNSAFAAEQIYMPLLFHYDAASIQVANGANVTRWPDSVGGNALVQGTTAYQPTYTAVDASISSHPSVLFNGTSQFLQNGLLNPIIHANPMTIFVVYYWAALTGSYVIDTASSAGGSAGDGIVVYRPSTLSIYSGTANIGALTVVATTPYVMAFAVNASTGYIGLNKAALASLASGTSGSARSITGLTLGATYNGAASWSNVAIAEVIGYAGLISSGNYATVAAGLAAKYAITLA